MTPDVPPEPSPLTLDETQLRCLTSPARREIFLALGHLGPSSVSEIAGAVGRTPDALYYHLRELVRSALVRSLGKRAARTRREEVYQADRRYLRVDPGNRSGPYLAARRRMLSSVVRTFGSRVGAALEAPDALERTPPPLVLRSHLVRLDDEALAGLDARLAELDDFIRTHTKERGGRVCSVLLGRVAVEDAES